MDMKRLRCQSIPTNFEAVIVILWPELRSDSDNFAECIVIFGIFGCYSGLEEEFAFWKTIFLGIPLDIRLGW